MGFKFNEDAKALGFQDHDILVGYDGKVFERYDVDVFRHIAEATTVQVRRNGKDLTINMPEDKVLRTFPSRVTVSFVTGVNNYRNLKASDFRVVADYNEIMAHPSEKCNLHLQRTPSGISRATLLTTQADYLIEQVTQP